MGSRFLKTWRPVTLASGTAWRNESKLCQLLLPVRWRCLCFSFFISLGCVIALFSLWFIVCSLLTHILCFFWSLPIFLITSWLLCVLCLSVLYLSISLSASVSVSLYLLSPSHSFFFLWRMHLIVRSVKPLRPVKSCIWSHLASLRVFMKYVDMLICTKPILLMKTQYWLPFIRLIMKYQYHLPS